MKSEQQRFAAPHHPHFDEAHHPMSEERRMSAIVADVWDNADKLVGQHLQLALSELEARADDIKADLTIVTLGGLVLYAGVLAAVAAVILALSIVIAPWLSALLVGVVAMAVGYVMLQRKRELTPHPGSSQSAQSLKRTGHTLKEAVK
jgi:hypothetical protein